jgi:amino acid adenylation domain-containing protein
MVDPLPSNLPLAATSVSQASDLIQGLAAEQRRELLRKLLEKKTQTEPVFPLSLGQEALWFLDQLDPGRPTYSLHPAVRVKGPLNLTALEAAIGELLRRHDVLRTTFPARDGLPEQRITPYQPFQLEVVDLTHLPAEQREEEAQRMATSRNLINLQTGPVFHAQAVRIAPNDLVLLMQIHHIVFDGWSLGVMTREMAELYQSFCTGKPSSLPALPLRYVDFATWQRQHLSGAKLNELQTYWRHQLAHLPPLEAPTDYPRPKVRTSRGASIHFKFTGELTRALVDFSRRQHVTPFMTLLAAFQELLHRWSGQEDFAVGTPIANRRQKQFEPLIGYFINMLVLRADVSGDPSFAQLVQRVLQTTSAAFAHQDLTLDKVMDAVQPARDPSRHPLFQVMFVLQNNRQNQLKFPELEVESLSQLRRDRAAKFELTVPLRITPEGLTGKINFNTDLFAQSTIEQLAQQYEQLISAAITSPDLPLSQLPLVGRSQRHDFVHHWSGHSRLSTHVDCRSVYTKFVQQTALVPEAIAIVDGQRTWTYAELDQLASRIAQAIQARPSSSRPPVALRLERSAAAVAAMLGIFKAGAAYLPLDPSLPASRAKFILADAGAETLITSQQLHERLPLDVPHTLLVDQVLDEGYAANPIANSFDDLDQLAYVIYTSGSTGTPKGVMIDHRALTHYSEAAIHEYGITRRDRVLQFASLSFDAHVEEVYPVLSQGGTLVIRTPNMLDSIAQFLQICQQQEITVLSLPTGFWGELTSALDRDSLQLPSSLRLLIIGGEAARPETVSTWFRVVGSRVRLLNTYGPTETTVVATAAELTIADSHTDRVSIGRPLTNTTAYVLDEHLRPVPTGVAGELFLGGRSVARGYLRQPELSAAKFIDHPFFAELSSSAHPSTPGERRLYRTGDLVRWRTDGQLEFIGRRDGQVKIRGFRIESGEVEQVLGSHAKIGRAAVVVAQKESGQPALVAYYSGAGSASPPDVLELRRFLQERLPDYMIPELLVPLPTMPLTSSDKIDRKSLPVPDWTGVAAGPEYVAPVTATEQALGRIWQEVLSRPQVGLKDHFFDLGGNSLLALRLTAAIRRELSVELPLVQLFAAPTLAELAREIEQLQGQSFAAQLPAMRQVPDGSPQPITYAQEHFWQVIHLFPKQPFSLMHATLPVVGQINLPAFEAAFKELIRRHEPLRTSFMTDAEGVPHQVVHADWQMELPVTDISELHASQQEEFIQQVVQHHRREQFDFSRLPLFRIDLLKRSANSHCLIVTTTHLIFDGWSMQILIRELSEIYEALQAGNPSSLPPLKVQFADYAAWERQHLSGAYFDELLAYWRGKLTGVRNLELPTQRPRDTKLRHVENHYSFTIDEELRTAATQLARRANTTRFCVMLAVYHAALSRYANNTDVAVAIPVANRRFVETQQMLGLFINTVVHRNDLSGNPTFLEILARVHQTATEAAQHEQMPFGTLALDLQPNLNTQRFPLVQVMFNYLQRISTKRPRRPEALQIQRELNEHNPVSTRLDVTWSLAESDTDWRCLLHYDEALFGREFILDLADDLSAITRAVTQDPTVRLSSLPIKRATPATLSSSSQSGTEACEVVDIRPLPSPTYTHESRHVNSAATTKSSSPSRSAPASGGPAAAHPRRWLAPLRTHGSDTPLFCFPGLGGHAISFLPLSRALPAGRPIYAFQAQGLDGREPPHRSLSEMASSYLTELLAVQPEGPYYLAGWSLGGLIALDAARQLQDRQQNVALVALLDTHLRVSKSDIPEMGDTTMLRRIARQLNIPPDRLIGQPPEQQWDLIATEAASNAGVGVAEIGQLAEVCRAQFAALRDHQLQPYLGPVVMLRQEQARTDLDQRWATLCPNMTILTTPGDHYSMLQQPAVAQLATQLAQFLEQASHSSVRAGKAEGALR